MTARILLLAGSIESIELARALGARTDLTVISLFVGRRESVSSGGPGGIGGPVRIGRIESASALAEIIDSEQIDLLIDGTHPCMSDLPRLARQAGEAMRVPRLRLIRPMWRRHPLDRWIEVSDTMGAAAVLPRVGKRVLSMLDEVDLCDIVERAPDIEIVARLPRAPRSPLPPQPVVRLLIERGPGSVVAERGLMQRLHIEALMMRAEGGALLEPAVLAAREAGRPVVMIRRPPVDLGERAESIENALVWIERRLTQLRPRMEIVTVDPGSIS